MPLQWPEPEQCRHLAPGPGVFQLGVSVEPLGALRPIYAAYALAAVPCSRDHVFQYSHIPCHEAFYASAPEACLGQESLSKLTWVWRFQNKAMYVRASVRMLCKTSARCNASLIYCAWGAHSGGCREGGQ